VLEGEKRKKEKGSPLAARGGKIFSFLIKFFFDLLDSKDRTIRGSGSGERAERSLKEISNFKARCTGERKGSMPTFPRKENDVLSLVNQMIAGYTEHAVDFPSSDTEGLTAKRTTYVTALNAQADAAAAAKIATESKNTALVDLRNSRRRN